MRIPDPKDRTFETMTDFGVTHIVYGRNVNESIQEGLIDFLAENPDQFHLIFENTDFQVYEVSN